MLKELHVKNFAIIDDIKIDFDRGLNILSGETGAGKTLIIEAINLLIGERADSSLIRDGKDKLLVQGFFDFRNNEKVRDYLIKNNILDEEDFHNDIAISRELNRTGKNKAFINGLFTQVNILKGLGDSFLDIHGQHDHQHLLDPGTHIDIVDNYAKSSILPLKEAYKIKYQEYHLQKKKLDDLLRMQENRDTRLQDLKFRYDEIERLKIKKDEEENLNNELSVLKNFENIYRLASETEDLIKGSENEKSSIPESISIIQINIDKLASIDSRFKDFSERMNSLSDIIDEISYFIGSYLSDFDFSRERLDAIQERLYSFSLIKKKYNIDISKTEVYLRKIKDEIESYESLENNIEKCRDGIKIVLDTLVKSALLLSSEREAASGILEEKITEELNDLGFKSVDFRIQKDAVILDSGVSVDPDLFKRNGIDNIEFYISLNTGESPRPLRKVASGGEVSRVMLALKSALGDADNISTMIFDEIDSGIGGAISLIVGEKLYSISLKKQTIVISHLAQIACFSTSHYLIDKYVDEGRTKIHIKKLDKEGKVVEISRMLGGSNDSDISIRHARELIERSDSIKENLEKETLKVGN